MTRAACTIVSPNYLHFARTLAKSFLAHHPDARFFVLIVADTADAAPFEGGGFEPVMLGELGLADLRGEAMKYDILELNTNVKPAFLRHLLRTHGFDAVVYLDPDIFVYAPLDPVFDALAVGATAVITPHMLAPVWDGKGPGEQDLLYNGTYNLGFIGVGAHAEALRLLDWWDVRCLDAGFSEGRSGLFVDQKWINLVPALFDRVVISRDAGLNVAYWNLHERSLRFEGGRYVVDNTVTGPVPLRFFHFSGVVVDEPDTLSKHTDRFTMAERPDLHVLFADYTAAVRSERDASAAAGKIPYGFDRFSDGTTVTRLARRLFAVHREHFREGDPFDSRGAFARWATATKLVAGQVAPAKDTWKQFNARDRRVDAVHRLLKTALRLLGPHRYELLMRYLAHIAILRNQGVFLRDPRWPEGPQ